MTTHPTTIEQLIIKAGRFGPSNRWKGERKACTYRLPADLVEAIRLSAANARMDVNTFVVRAIERAIKP